MVCLSKAIMSKDRASSPPTVSSRAPTDNKGDPCHIMCNSSKYFLILRLARKRPITGGNKIRAVTSKKGGAVSVPSFRLWFRVVIQVTCWSYQKSAFFSFSLHIPTYLHILGVFCDEIRTLKYKRRLLFYTLWTRPMAANIKLCWHARAESEKGFQPWLASPRGGPADGPSANQCFSAGLALLQCSTVASWRIGEVGNLGHRVLSAPLGSEPGRRWGQLVIGWRNWKTSVQLTENLFSPRGGPWRSSSN